MPVGREARLYKTIPPEGMLLRHLTPPGNLPAGGAVLFHSPALAATAAPWAFSTPTR